MTLGDLVAGVRGVGAGASLGAIRYPAALSMVGIDKLIGEGKLSYREALALIREQDRADMEEHKGARLAGEIAGTIGSSLATGGGGLLAQAAKAGATGAISGFTANEGMENAGTDTLRGAALGSTLGALGAGVQKVQAGAAKYPYVQSKREVIAEGEKAVQRLSEPDNALMKFIKRNIPPKDRPRNAQEMAELLTKLRSTNTNAGLKKDMPPEVLEELQVITRGIASKQRLDTLAKATPEQAIRQVRNPDLSDLKQYGLETYRMAREMAPTVAAGAGAGGALGYFTDKDPVESAQIGAAAVGIPLLLRKPGLYERGVGVLASRLPARTGEIAARTGAAAGAPILARAIPQEPGPVAPTAPASGPQFPWEDEQPAPAPTQMRAPAPASGPQFPWEE